MPAATTLVLLVIVPGGLVLLTSFHAAMRLKLHTDAFLTVMKKTLRNGDRTRAQKLSCVSSAPVAMVTRRALELRLPRFDPEGYAGDYREAPEQGFEDRARESLAPVAAEQLARYRLSLYSSALALVAVVAAATLVWREGVGGMEWLGWAALGVGVLAAVLNVLRYRQAKHDIARTVEMIAPFVERE